MRGYIPFAGVSSVYPGQMVAVAVYHSIWEEWLMLWAYGGGQKTQQSCFCYNMLESFILSSISATHGLSSGAVQV